VPQVDIVGKGIGPALVVVVVEAAQSCTVLGGHWFSWPENASTSKCSGLARISGCLVPRMDPVVECLEIMALSPRPGDVNYDENDALPQLNFQFTDYVRTPSECIDMGFFKRSPSDILPPFLNITCFGKPNCLAKMYYI
jgi:hypothetical protein